MHHLVFEEITYDIEALTALYKKMQDCALEYNEHVHQHQTTSKGNIQKLQKQPPGSDGRLLAVYSPMFEGKEMTDYPEVQQVLSNFNFLSEPKNESVSFQINEPNHKFMKHIDRNLEYRIMLPLLPRDDLAPLTFWNGEEKNYTLNYSMKHPTAFNGKIIHSTEPNSVERVVFNIKVSDETFEDMVVRYNAGTFLNI